MKILFVTSTHPSSKQGNGVLSHMHDLIVSEIGGTSTYRFYYSREKVEVSDNRSWYVKGVDGKNKVISVLMGYPPMISKNICDTIIKVIAKEGIDVVYIDNSITGKLIKKIKSKFPKIYVIAFFVDIETIRMKNERNVSIFRKIALPVYYRNEADTVQYADRTIVLNSRDAQLYKKIHGKFPDMIAPICAPAVDFIDTERIHECGQRLNILFVGVDYAPNVNGLRWFISEVIPNIKVDFEFNIVGLNMEKYQEEFEQKSSKVHVLGTVDSLYLFYEKADVVVGPIFEGGGMKVKAAEAFLHGKFFIGCSECLVGYWEDIPNEFKMKKIFKCDEAQAFGKVINSLFITNYSKNDIKIKKWAEQIYTYQSVLHCYKKVFDTCVLGDKL